ncbi:MAG: hypothetical protein Q4E61_01270 [Alphaproteobacteria bacterium]|nr:hypothetical protein [Alphaproteobacteria bacterium]
MKDYNIECIESEILNQLDNNGKVFIESGAANDSIDSYSVRKYKTYSWQEYEEKEITFTTSACIFPKEIKLSDFDNIDTVEELEEFIKENYYEEDN